MITATLHNYLRTHRRNAGLSQRQMARLLGHRGDGQVSRHELSKSIPPLLTALAYECIFQVSVGQLFPGVKQAVAVLVENRIRDLKKELEDSTVRGPKAIPIAQGLEWITEREISGEA